MKRLITCLLAFLLLPTLPVQSEDAMEYIRLGQKAYTANGKIKYLSKALELNPGLAAVYHQRGMLYYYQEKYESAIQDFESYARLRPDEAEGYRMQGMSYLKKGTYDAAIAILTHTLKVDPTLNSAFCYRAEAYRRKGNDERAIRDSTRAIQLGGNPRVVADAYITRAKIFRKLGRYEEAGTDIRSALEIDPRSYFYRYVAGYANLEQIRGAGLVALIVVALILIFKLALRAPKKED